MEQTAGLYHVWPHRGKNWPLCQTSAVYPHSFARALFCKFGLSPSKIALLFPIPCANLFSDKMDLIKTGTVGGVFLFHWCEVLDLGSDETLKQGTQEALGKGAEAVSVLWVASFSDPSAESICRGTAKDACPHITKGTHLPLQHVPKQTWNNYNT